MPHVSQKILKQQTVDEIRTILAKTLSGLRGTDGKRFIEELLTETETLMLAKRLAIIVLLDAGYSRYRVEKELGVSTSTVTRINARLEAGLFDTIRTLHKKKRDAEKVWRLVEKVAYVSLRVKGSFSRLPRTPYTTL